jgi:putative acetyltransferase
VGIIIRRIRPGDADALVAFYNGLSARSKRTFRPLDHVATWDTCEEIVRDNELEPEKKFDLIALHEDRIVGWSFVWDLQSGEPVFGLGIADAYQGRGLGSELMDRVIEVAREHRLGKVHLTVVQDNRVAWRMYEKRGFVRYGEFVGKDELPYFRMVAELVREDQDERNTEDL